MNTHDFQDTDRLHHRAPSMGRPPSTKNAASPPALKVAPKPNDKAPAIDKPLPTEAAASPPALKVAPKPNDNAPPISRPPPTNAASPTTDVQLSPPKTASSATNEGSARVYSVPQPPDVSGLPNMS